MVVIAVVAVAVTVVVVAELAEAAVLVAVAVVVAELTEAHTKAYWMIRYRLQEAQQWRSAGWQRRFDRVAS